MKEQVKHTAGEIPPLFFLQDQKRNDMMKQNICMVGKLHWK
jgi:hypothetical protein